MNAKALFLRDKELTKWWVNVVHDDRFEQVCAYALADFTATVKSHDELTGAKDFIERLATISDNDESFQEMPSPGLIHNIEAMPPALTFYQDLKPDAAQPKPKKAK